MSIEPTSPSTTAADGAAGPSARASRVVVAGIALIAVVVIGYFALGMPGMDMEDGSSDTGNESADGMTMDMEGMEMNGRAIGVDAFAARMDDPDAVLINVHVPDEGEIAGTDLSIPFDQVSGDLRLPENRGRPILLYCRSGRMSQVAAAALVSDGFTDVVQLEGGMNAWTASGRDLVPT